MRKFGVILITLLLSACATSPTFKLDNIDYNLTAKNATHTGSNTGQTVLWGGTILSSQNLKDKTRLEVLAYPVDKQGRLDTDAQPLGRFYGLYNGYLETAEYRKNRWISLTGTFAGMETGKVGDADYRFPLVEITQLHLWTQDSLQSNSPNIQFGIGVLFH